MAAQSSGADLKFRAFSDRIRLRLLHILLDGEMCVCDLVTILKIPQPTASRHLAYLRKAGLVTTEKRGLWMYYTLSPAKTKFHQQLISCLKTCFEEVGEIRQDKTRQSKIKKSGGCC